MGVLDVWGVLDVEDLGNGVLDLSGCVDFDWANRWTDDVSS